MSHNKYQTKRLHFIRIYQTFRQENKHSIECHVNIIKTKIVNKTIMRKITKIIMMMVIKIDSHHLNNCF